MGESVDGLLDVLTKECGLYRDLYDLSRKKSEIILDGNVEGLTGILSVEQQLIIELGYLGAQREELIEELASSMDIDPQRLTLSQIITFLEENSEKRMKHVWNDLSEVISQQKQINDLNESLIKNNLEYIDFSLRLLAGQEELGVAYSKAGKTSAKQQNRNLFDKRV